MNIHTRSKNSIIIICMIITPLMGMALDLYTPSLPAIALAFNVSTQAAKFTLLIYAAAFGIAQVITGPLSDLFGRKWFMWAALILYVIASSLATLCTHIDLFYLCRIGQAIGGATIAAVLKAMIVDSFTGKRLAKANMYYSMSWSLTPILAPAIGGYLQHYFNWQANFIFMAAYALMGIIFCVFLLHETLPAHRVQKNPWAWVQQWGMLFRAPLFLSGCVLLAIQFIVLMLYYTTAPFVIQKTLHINAAHYGEIMLLIGLAYFFGNIVNARCLPYFEINSIVLFGLIGSLITVIVMAIITRLLPLSIYTATVPIFCLFFWDGFIFANILTRTLAPYSAFAGTAGSLMGGILNVLTAVISTFCNRVWDLHSLFTLSVVYIVLMGVSLVLFCGV